MSKITHVRKRSWFRAGGSIFDSDKYNLEVSTRIKRSPTWLWALAFEMWRPRKRKSFLAAGWATKVKLLRRNSTSNLLFLTLLWRFEVQFEICLKVFIRVKSDLGTFMNTIWKSKNLHQPNVLKTPTPPEVILAFMLWCHIQTMDAKANLSRTEIQEKKNY